MMKMIRTILIATCTIAVLAATSWTAAAQTNPLGIPPAAKPREQKSADQLVKVTAVTDAPNVKPGQTFHLAFIFEIEPHWHIYWRNSGDSGMPTSIQINAPLGFVRGSTLFPRPMKFVTEDGVSYGYENRTVIFVKMTAPAELPAGPMLLHVTTHWMVCKDVCLLGRTTHRVPINTNARQPESETEQASDPIVQQFKLRLPKLLNETPGAQASLQEDTLVITLPAQGRNSAEFFPAESPGVTFGEPTITADQQQIVIRVPLDLNPNDAMGEPMRVNATVGLGESPDDPAFDLDLPVN